MLLCDSLFKNLGTVLRAHPLHQRAWALKVSKLRLWSLKWRIGKFLEPTYESWSYARSMCVPAITRMHVRGGWHGVCGEFLFCLHVLGLPRLNHSAAQRIWAGACHAKLQAKNQKKKGASCPRQLLQNLGIDIFSTSGSLFKLGYVHVYMLLFSLGCMGGGAWQGVTQAHVRMYIRMPNVYKKNRPGTTWVYIYVYIYICIYTIEDYHNDSHLKKNPPCGLPRPLRTVRLKVLARNARAAPPLAPHGFGPGLQALLHRKGDLFVCVVVVVVTDSIDLIDISDRFIYG